LFHGATRMAFLDWKNEFNTGIEAIDTDHKFLVSLINQLDEALRDGQNQEVVGSVLNALYDYTNYHFLREEKMMKACGYTDEKEHAAQHQDLKTQVMEARDAYLKQQTDDIKQPVMDFMKTWLADHILGHDMQYVSSMLANRDAAENAARIFDNNKDWMLTENGDVQ
jgi:hemerythrin-like metal-binding protein